MKNESTAKKIIEKIATKYPRIDATVDLSQNTLQQNANEI